MAGEGIRSGGGVPQFQGVGTGSGALLRQPAPVSPLASGLASAADILRGARDRMMPAVRHQVATEAETAGQAAGLAAWEDGQEPALRTEDGSISAAAFNKGALAAYAGGVKIDAATTAERLATQHEDPAAFAKSWDQYEAGVIGQMPAALRPDVTLELRRQKAASLAAIEKTWTSRQRQAQADTLHQSLDTLRGQLIGAARDGNAGDMEVLAGQANDLLDAMVEAGHLSGAQAAAARDGLRDDVQVQSVLGEWKAAGYGRGFLDRFSEQRPDGMDPEVHDRVVARMRAEYNTRQAMDRVGLKALTKKVGDAIDVLEKGYDLAGLDTLAAEVSGTPLEAELAAARQDGAFLQAFAQQPLTAQATVLDQLRAREQTPRSADLLGRLERAHENSRTALSQDPLGHAARVGVVSIAPLDLSQPDTLPDQMANRVRAAEVAGEVYGVPVLPLRREETDLLATAVKEGSAATNMAVLGALSSLPDEHLARTLEALAPKAPAFAAAAGIAGEAPDAAASILRGMEARKAMPGAAPKPTDYRPVLDETFGTAFAASPQTRQHMEEAVLAVYADAAARAGETSGEFDETRLDEAVKTVTGGIVEWRGQRLVPPRRGMSDGDFEDLMDALPVERLAGAVTAKGQPLTPEHVSRFAKLEQVGDGRYLLRFPTGYALDADGGPFVLDLGEGG